MIPPQVVALHLFCPLITVNGVVVHKLIYSINFYFFEYGDAT